MRAITLLLLLFAPLAPAQIQIMPADKLAALRESLPVMPRVWEEVFWDKATLFYTEAEMPSCFQHADAGLIVNGARMGFSAGNRATTVHLSANNISGNPIEAAKGDGYGGNANVEFPWRSPGGTDLAEGDTRSFKIMQLPRKDDGRPWPVAIYSTVLRGSRMGPHNGFAWMFPLGTIFGEVLVIRDSAGLLHTWEIRLRIREATYWNVEILRPFVTEKELARRLGVELNTPVVSRQLKARHPTKISFASTAGETYLPSLGEKLAMELLDSTPFKSAVGAVWKEQDGVKVFAPTTKERYSLVPREYLGTHLGTETTSCKKCHESVGMHVDQFDVRRDWYGTVRGSLGIFSFHPFAISSISPNGVPRAVRLRQAFVSAGTLEWYDPVKHPKEMYSTVLD